MNGITNHDFWANSMFVWAYWFLKLFFGEAMNIIHTLLLIYLTCVRQCLHFCNFWIYINSKKVTWLMIFESFAKWFIFIVGLKSSHGNKGTKWKNECHLTWICYFVHFYATWIVFLMLISLKSHHMTIICFILLSSVFLL